MRYQCHVPVTYGVLQTLTVLAGKRPFVFAENSVWGESFRLFGKNKIIDVLFVFDSLELAIRNLTFLKQRALLLFFIIRLYFSKIKSGYVNKWTCAPFDLLNRNASISSTVFFRSVGF